MRLIRLTTERNDGHFDCNFNEDLVFEPNSKIALHSFTTQFPYESLEINSINNKLTYSVDGDDNSTIVIMPDGVYTNANIQEFFTTLEQRLNMSMKTLANVYYKQWQVGMYGGRVNFNITRGIPKITGGSNCVINQYVQKLVTPGGLIRYQRNGGTITTNDAFIYWNVPMAKGANYFGTKLIEDPSPGALGGFICGLTKNCPDATTTIINDANINYGVRFIRTTDPYRIIVNGITSITAIMPEIGDMIQFETYGGKIYFRVYRTGSGIGIELSNQPYNHIDNLFPLQVFVGDTILNASIFYSDPYYLPSSITDTLETGLEIPFYPPVKTNNFLQFDNSDISARLGFNNPRMPVSGYYNTIDYQYIGNKAFGLRDYSETYIVELLNIQLDSMDAMTNQHKNYLAVIPQISQIREHVVYVSPTLIFLNLNNRYPMSYRQIRARILKDDLSEVITYGLSQMTILVKSANEA